MSVDPMMMAYARYALAEAARGFIFDPNVSLIDFGFPETDNTMDDHGLAIRFHVRRKLDDLRLEMAEDAGLTRRVPERIGGFETDVQQATYHKHLLAAPRGDPHRIRSSRLQGGLSVSSDLLYGAGTLGGLVVDNKTGAPMLLSNWHVLVGHWWAKPGEPILQPGWLDGGSAKDKVANLTRDGMTSFLDAAAATIEGNDRQLVNEEMGLGRVSGLGEAYLGMQVVKCGRTSDITYGRVTGTEGRLSMSYDGIDRIIQHVVTIDQLDDGSQVSEAGDSGAFWCERDTMRVVALHFAGTNQPERALALDMTHVFDTLDVSLFNR